MKAWNDFRVEQIIGNLLRAGVLLSAVVVLTGGVGYLIGSGGKPAAHAAFHGEPRNYTGLGAVLGAAAGGDWLAVVQVGLLLLIATPVARVAFSLVAFGLERDRTYMVVTVLVLAILLYSVIGQH